MYDNTKPCIMKRMFKNDVNPRNFFLICTRAQVSPILKLTLIEAHLNKEANKMKDFVGLGCADILFFG